MALADVDWIPAGTTFGRDDMVFFAGKGERVLDDVLEEIDLIVTGPHASAAFPEEMAPFVDGRLTRRLQYDFTDVSTSPVARRWAEIFDAAGVPAVVTDRLAALLWAKVFYNAALNPLGALLNVHYGALPDQPESRDLMDRVIDEAFAVAGAEGVALNWVTAADYRQEFYVRLVPATYDHRSSMLQDLERGRRTEIDAINGAVWHRGAARGITTPVNETLTRLVHAVEQPADT